MPLTLVIFARRVWNTDQGCLPSDTKWFNLRIYSKWFRTIGGMFGCWSFAPNNEKVGGCSETWDTLNFGVSPNDLLWDLFLSKHAWEEAVCCSGCLSVLLFNISKGIFFTARTDNSYVTFGAIKSETILFNKILFLMLFLKLSFLKAASCSQNKYFF